MMLAATHVPIGATVVPALLVAGVLGWYWRRLSRPGVPGSRRRIRRASMVMMALALPPLVVGFSVVDGDVDPQRYVLVWSLAGLLLLGVLLTATVDVLNNLRLVTKSQEQDAAEAARELLATIRAREGGGRRDRPSPADRPRPDAAGAPDRS